MSDELRDAKPRLNPDGTWAKGVDQKNRFAWSDEVKQAFLYAYAETFNMGQAADRVGVPRRTVYDWLKNDPEWKAAFEDTKEACMDNVEATLYQISQDEAVAPRDRIMASGWILNAHREGYKRKDDERGGTPNITFIMGPKPDEKPKQLPKQTGEVIDLDAWSDKLKDGDGRD